MAGDTREFLSVKAVKPHVIGRASSSFWVKALGTPNETYEGVPSIAGRSADLQLWCLVDKRAQADVSK
jgi:hypothetical protein